MKIVKQLRLRWRLPDKTAMFERVDAEDGEELLLVSPDGTMLTHVIGGPADSPVPVHDQLQAVEEPASEPVSAPETEPVTTQEPVPVRAPERDLPRSGPVRVMPPLDRAPVRESVPDNQKPVQPANVSGMTHDSALQLARTVWGSGDGAELSRSSLFHGISAQSAERWTAHAEAMGWVAVDGDRIKRGAVDPNPPPEVLSPRERRMRWGPSWIG